MQAAGVAIGSSLADGQTGVVEAANAAAFSTSNASAIATANATAIALAADNGTCTSYPVQSYGTALSSVLSDNNTEAAAAGIAAGFAQGCCVSSVTALSVLDLIAIDGCTSIIGGILLSKHFVTSFFIKALPSAMFTQQAITARAYIALALPTGCLPVLISALPAFHCSSPFIVHSSPVHLLQAQ